MASDAGPPPTISGIFIYPVKACRGLALQEAAVTPTGFRFDREWMVVSAQGRFLSQRNAPRLALVTPTLPREALDPSHGWAAPGGPAGGPGAALTLAAPGMPPLLVPLEPPAGAPPRAVRTVGVWEHTGPALDEGDDAAAWFATFLNEPGARLVRWPRGAGAPPARRPTEAEWAPGYETAFSDGYPFLIISQASLDGSEKDASGAPRALNARLPAPLPMNRFRPNLVAAGCEPFAEDGWEAFAVGPAGGTGTGGGRAPLLFRGVKPCSRCKVTTTDQATGVPDEGGEPLTTLRTFRSGAVLGAPNPKWRAEVFVGSNLICEGPEGGAFPPGGAAGGLVRVGDAIAVRRQRTALPAPLPVA